MSDKAVMVVLRYAMMTAALVAAGFVWTPTVSFVGFAVLVALTFVVD